MLSTRHKLAHEPIVERRLCKQSHPERSEAESKIPRRYAELLQRDSSTPLGMTFRSKLDFAIVCSCQP